MTIKGEIKEGAGFVKEEIREQWQVSREQSESAGGPRSS
jgi:hypothetical protein